MRLDAVFGLILRSRTVLIRFNVTFYTIVFHA